MYFRCIYAVLHASFERASKQVGCLLKYVTHKRTAPYLTQLKPVSYSVQKLPRLAGRTDGMSTAWGSADQAVNLGGQGENIRS